MKEIKKYFALYKEILKETQINRRVDLNIEIKRFRELNNIVVNPTQTRDLELFYEGKHVANMIIKYSKRKINLEYKELGYKLVFLEKN